MLSELRIRNFKCFADEVLLSLGQLNLLTGLNSRGKSSALQPLLCLSQTLDHSPGYFNDFSLNGPLTSLGTFREVRNRTRPESEPIAVGLELEFDGGDYLSVLFDLSEALQEREAHISKLQYEGALAGKPFEMELTKNLTSTSDPGVEYKEPPLLTPPTYVGTLGGSPDVQRAADLRRMHFVCADRLGPRDYYPRETMSRQRHVGNRGQFTAEVLHAFGFDRVDEALCVHTLPEPPPNADRIPRIVQDQASAWLGHIFDGARLEVRNLDDMALAIRMNADGTPGATFRMPNLGFGYGYILPIVVSCLVAHPGELLIVENPEAHLHPAAQSRLATLLARLASAGVQVFVESHSEHILNAFRVAVREKLLDASALRVFFFRAPRQEEILTIPIGQDGSICTWPDGFFDQRSQDFFRLHGI